MSAFSLLVVPFIVWSLRAWSIGSATDNVAQVSTCRNVPGSPGYPTSMQWEALNTTVSGRLVKVVPFVEFCNDMGGCTEEQSASSSFRANVPGAMDQVKLSLPPFYFPHTIETDICTISVAKLGTGWDCLLTMIDVNPQFTSARVGLFFKPTICL